MEFWYIFLEISFMSPRPHNNITFYCRTNIHSDQVRLGVVGRTMYIFIQVVLRLDSQQRPSVRTASVRAFDDGYYCDDDIWVW